MDEIQYLSSVYFVSSWISNSTAVTIIVSGNESVREMYQGNIISCLSVSLHCPDDGKMLRLIICLFVLYEDFFFVKTLPLEIK